MRCAASKPESARRSGPKTSFVARSSGDRLGRGHDRCGRRAVKPAGVPDDQVPQIPQAEVVVSPAATLLLEQPLNEAELEVLASQGRVEDVLLGALQQPWGEHVRRRAAKAALFAIDQLGLQPGAFSDSFQHPFGDAVAIL